METVNRFCGQPRKDQSVSANSVPTAGHSYRAPFSRDPGWRYQAGEGMRLNRPKNPLCTTFRQRGAGQGEHHEKQGHSELATVKRGPSIGVEDWSWKYLGPSFTYGPRPR